eukprot:4857659-Prorocentrum_lima.AAC.1
MSYQEAKVEQPTNKEDSLEELRSQGHTTQGCRILVGGFDMVQNQESQCTVPGTISGTPR